MFDAPGGKKNALDRFLSLFGDVRAGEALTAVLLTLNLFFLLTGYLIIKTVREPLILASGGAEVKSYAAAGQALLLFLIVPAYGLLASKINRVRLITWITLFFISNLILFYVLAERRAPIGVPFFLWVGIFNLFVVAQFWSFANDLYTLEQGKRLFGIVAFGGSAGAIMGPKLAGWLVRPLGVFELLLVAGAILALYIAIANIVHARETRPGRAVEKKDAEKPLARDGGFKLVVGRRYLFMIALLVVVLNVVNTTGEYMLGKLVTREAQNQVIAAEQEAGAAALVTAAERQKIKQEFIGAFYGNFYFWVSLIGAAIQLFLAARLIKYVGAAALFFLPLVAMSGYFMIALLPILRYIQPAKVLENATNYSLQNTVHHTLFLPTSREVKYKAKAAIDTFFVRTGDVLSAIVVFLGAQMALGVETFAGINIAVGAIWMILAAAIVRENRALSLAHAGAVKS